MILKYFELVIFCLIMLFFPACLNDVYIIKYENLQNIYLKFQTGRSRGFCFVYFESQDDAKVAKNECTGMEIDGRRIRVDYSITQRAHTPTPGIYMGKPTQWVCFFITYLNVYHINIDSLGSVLNYWRYCKLQKFQKCWIGEI